ncbi:MAG: hypothetical protein CMC48_03740 [Flavobacteriaceae bacterium]|nr:hypothetical protein [Flavobacteriaceae bacterium]
MKKQPNKWLIFSGLFFQIAIIMYLSYLSGKEVKTKFSIDSDIPVLISSIIGLSIIIYFIIKQSKLL